MEPPLQYCAAEQSDDGIWHIDGMFERGGCSLVQNQVSMMVASGRSTYDAISTDSIAVRTEHLRYPQNIYTVSLHLRSEPTHAHWWNVV